MAVASIPGERRKRGEGKNTSARSTTGGPDGAPDAWAFDRLAMRLQVAARALTPHLARVAEALVGRESWTFYGYARLDDYAKGEHDRSGRWFQDWAKLGAALNRFPVFEDALLGRDGPAVGAAAAAKIARVATEETIAAWIERARRVTVRELSEEIRARRGHGQTAPGPELGEPGADAETNQSCADGGSWGTSASRTTLEADDPDIEPRTLMGFEAPRKVALAFEDTLDLHRSVCGSEATVQSFVEAMSAEAATGIAPPDCMQEPLREGDPTAQREHACARANQRWAGLKGTGDPGCGGAPQANANGDTQTEPAWWHSGASRSMQETLRTIHTLETQAKAVLDELRCAKAIDGSLGGKHAARALHERARYLLEFDAALERGVGRVLFLMSARGDFASLGFASLGHYAVERLGMARSTAEGRAHLLFALRRLSRVRAAYEAGEVGLDAAWNLYRILRWTPCPPEEQDRWIQHTVGLQVRRLREERRRLQRQELTRPEPPSLRAALDLPPSPRPATNDEWLASLRRVAGDTRARLRRLQLAGVDDPCATLADLQRTLISLRFRLPGDIADVFRGALEASRRRLTELAREQIAADAASGAARDPSQDRASLRAARAFVERERRVPTWVALLAMLEEYAETHDNPAGFPKRRWDPVYEKWGWICRAPGCTVRVGIEDHHIQYRSRSGSDDLINQVPLCGFHHRQGEHGEFMRVWGKAPANIHWRMGARELAVEYFNDRRITPRGTGRI